jgi:DNA-binding response OmpR family regulator
MLLRMHGHDVDTGADGHEAIAAVSRHKPDAALIDICLEDLSGFEVAAQIRQLAPNAVLIAVTGCTICSSEERSVFDHYLLKPVDFKAVLSRVATHLAIEDDACSSRCQPIVMRGQVQQPQHPALPSICLGGHGTVPKEQ